VTIRAVSAADSGRIAALAHQLGYPSPVEAVRARLARILEDDNRIVYVAELADGHTVGWIDVAIHQLLIVEQRAEIEGLIIDEKHRGHGIGQRLIDQAETWAKEKGCKTIYVRSNIIRGDTHVFYKNLGYRNVKTQLAFQKPL
jgi:GNAT superfamily N-acetyltransferase